MKSANPPAPVVINTRFLGHEVTGVQRYGREILTRFPEHFETAEPSGQLSPSGGHLWEQMTLPGLCRGRLLWSPGNTGPLTVSNQVVTIHDASTLDHPEWFSKKFALWYRYLLPRLARKVRKVITVSEFSRQRLMETCGISHDRIEVISNGVDPLFQPSSVEALTAFRQREQLDRPYFVYLGSLEPRKNVRTLLKAWKQLGLKEAELVLAGATGRVFRDRGFSELPENTRLWGRITEEYLPHLLSGATGFILPSLYEGFGIPPLEAMACGCPVAMSRTTSLPEVGGPAFDPVSGSGGAVYFDPLNVEQISESLRQLLEMDAATRNLLSQNGRDRAAQFTWDRAAAQTWKVLENEVGRP